MMSWLGEGLPKLLVLEAMEVLSKEEGGVPRPGGVGGRARDGDGDEALPPAMVIV
jgi:hypothetical protein